MTTERAYTVQDARNLFARWENGDATEADLAGGLYALIDALSTPPADDVREALASWFEEQGWRDYDAGALLAAFAVRLRGPATDAEWQEMNPTDALILDTRAFLAQRPMGAPIYRRIRKLVDALEAAREVHP